MDRPRRIRNSQYAVNIDVVEYRDLQTLEPEIGAMVMDTRGNLYVGNGEGWTQINGR